MAQEVLGMNLLERVGSTGQGLAGKEVLPTQSFSGWEPKKLFKRGDGDRFEDVAWTWGFDSRADGRSLVAADLDGDGDLDLLLSTRNAPRVLLFENVGSGGQALELELEATAGHREADGATVFVDGVGAFAVVLARGFVSSVSPRVHVGLGERTQAEVSVKWRSGKLERFGVISAGGVVKLVEGTEKGTLLNAFEPRRASVPRAWPTTLAEAVPGSPGPRVVQLFMQSCVPCQKEVPALNALFASGIPVLGLGLHPEAELERVRGALKMEYPAAVLPGAIGEAFEGPDGLALPTLLIYGKDGKLARVVRGGGALSPALLAELTALLR